jgi:hypothetical protein
MWTRRIAVTVAVVGVSFSLATPAFAAGPTPRGPIGGCGEGNTLMTVAEMQALHPTIAAFFDAADVNRDGYLCIHFFTHKIGGIALDNPVVGRL